MVQFIYLFSVIINLALAQNTQPFIYVTPSSTTPTTSSSSQDLDLINYDSANCVCDITYLKDYDCSCDVDTTTIQTGYFTTKRKTTLEQSYMLIEYPLCDTLRNNINEIIPSYINNIACLARQNKAYSGLFYNSQESSASASSASTSTSTDIDQNLSLMTQIGSSKSSGSLNFVNYNVTDFLLFYQNYAQMDSNPSQIQSNNLKYAPDFFGFCKLTPILKRNIVQYGTPCLNQLNQNQNNNQIQLSSDTNGIYSVNRLTQVKVATNNLEISIQPPTIVASQNDQGYSYGSYLNVTDTTSSALQDKIKFGGIFYLTTANLQMKSLKHDATPVTVECSGIQLGDTTQQYIIYITDIGNIDSTAFQIVYCQASPITTQIKVSGQKILVQFKYLSSLSIIQEQSYTDRLSAYVYKLFYPLYSFLSGSNLVFTLATLLWLLSI
ncbi:hypothetical protein ABPG74_001707 [Tetrahymena malaccensis]